MGVSPFRLYFSHFGSYTAHMKENVDMGRSITIVPNDVEALTDQELAGFAPNITFHHIARLRVTLNRRKTEITDQINVFIAQKIAKNEQFDQEDPTGLRRSHAYELHNFAVLDGGVDVASDETVWFHGVTPLGPQPDVLLLVVS